MFIIKNCIVQILKDVPFTRDILYIVEQMISPVPDIRTLQIDPTKDSYIVLACDGIWNSLTSQEVVDFVSERMDKLCSTEGDQKDPTTQHLKTICEEVKLDKCLEQILCFLHFPKVF